MTPTDDSQVGSTEAPRVAYLTPQYPKVSHSFIRREILELERRGYLIERFSIRPPDASQLVDASDQRETAKTFACLAQGPVRLLAAFVVVAATRPRRLLRAARAALSLLRRGHRGALAHGAYLLEACLLLRQLEERGVRHVHVHFGTNAASVALLIGKLGGPSFSMTVHGPDEFDCPGGHALAEKVRAASFTVAISSFTAAQLQRWTEPELWDRIHVVHCSVDEQFFRERTQATPVPPRFVCVGRICPQKGQLLLIEAFALVARAHPSARLVLAGDGELRGEAERAIRRLGIAEQVEITGWLDEAGVRRVLRGASCFVLPSFAEGLPVVIMEALAMGRPVISTFIAGIPELVIPGENGWLVPAGDVESLRAALLDALAQSGERLAEMGLAGADRARERHSLEREVSRLDELFRRCVLVAEQRRGL